MKRALAFLCFFYGMVSCNPNQTVKKQEATTIDSSVYHLVKTQQVLLTNQAEFEGHTSLYGASAFLINYQGKIYAVTARHLIGQDGGVEPQVDPDQITDYLLEWKMFPRVPIVPEEDTVIVKHTKMNYTGSDKDILLLPLSDRSFGIGALNPIFALPARGEKLFIIGCPYSEENCKQNMYEVTADAYDEVSGLIIGTMKEKVAMSGFSGAPLLNVKGEVVGVIRGGGEDSGIHYVAATFIAEIRKIQ